MLTERIFLNLFNLIVHDIKTEGIRKPRVVNKCAFKNGR